MSGGTQASAVGALAEPSFVYRDGRVRSERGAKRVRSFGWGRRMQDAVSVGSSEHFTLPRIAPQLREVNAYLGWFGPLARADAGDRRLGLLARRPGAGELIKAVGERVVKGSSGGPDAEAPPEVGLARRRDRLRRGRSRELSEVHLPGSTATRSQVACSPGPPGHSATGALQGEGALGPVDGFGLVALTDGCRWAGLEVEGGAQASGAQAPEHADLKWIRLPGGGWRYWRAPRPRR